MSQLPPPLNGGEQYLAAVYERLGEILARMPERPAEPEKASATGPETVELREPAPAPEGEGEALKEPAPPTRTTTARKRSTSRRGGT